MVLFDASEWEAGPPVKQILVADHDPPMRSLVKETLTPAIHCEILETADGAEALALARQEHPALVILAAALPTLSGVEICRTLKADAATRGIGVLVLGGSREPEVQGYALGASADGWLPKPLSPQALREMAQALVEG